MRAWQIHRYGSPEVFQLSDIPKPICGARDVLVRIHATSVNPVDFKIRAGLQRGLIRYRLPWVLGLDVSGMVVEVGAKVKNFRVGDEVVSSPTHRRQGSYAEYIAIHEREVAKKPARLSHAEAASLPLVSLTAWEALVGFGELSRGQRVLIHAGAGGVGCVAIQLAKHLGASEIATTCSAGKTEFVKQLGVTRPVDYQREAYDEVLSDYDLVLDSLGGEHRGRSLRVLKPGGKLASIVSGVPEATEEFGPNLGALVVGLRILKGRLGARFKGYRSANLMRKCDGLKLQRLMDLAEQGAIAAVIQRVYPFDELPAAHADAETGRVQGKLVIQVV